MEQNAETSVPMTPVVESKKKNGNGLKIATAIACVVAACGVGFSVYCLIDSNNKTQEISNLRTKIEEQNKTIAELSEQENTQQEESYNKSYQIGDLVTLKNGTSWNVIKDSDVNSDSVVLLSVDNVNSSNDIKISEVKNYLLDEYKNSISSALGSNVDIRLLTLGDVSELSGISPSNLVPGTSLENGTTPEFLYKTTTLISDDSDMLLGENPNMVCEAVVATQYGSSDPGRVCISTQTDTEPFRVVITIAKKDIKS
ncbi:hypothetical protein IKE97_01910 [Candidatus Saccharibacteria bacterium]|nr:hypothetical protein [Candidatus Saccharibacteria bacterium]